MFKVTLHDLLQSSYNLNPEYVKKIEEQGYLLQDDLSDMQHAVFYNPDNKHVLYGIRGTYDPSDILTDASIPLGRLKFTSRYENALAIAKHIEDNYMYDKLSISGHSLGGAIASELAKEFKDSTRVFVHTFNKPNVPFSSPNTENEQELRSRGDVVSILGREAVTIGGGINPFSVIKNHGIQNLDEIPPVYLS